MSNIRLRVSEPDDIRVLKLAEFKEFLLLVLVGLDIDWLFVKFDCCTAVLVPSFIDSELNLRITLMCCLFLRGLL